MAGAQVLNSLADRLLDLDGIIENGNSAMDTHSFVESMKNKNTKTKTRSDLQRITDYFKSVGENRNITEIPPAELDILLARAFLGMKKVKDGSEYEPDTIKGIQSSLHRHLTDNMYSANILTDQAFKHSRDVISSKQKFLKGQGKGNKRQRSDPFTDDELKILEQRQLLGKGSPESLINSLWLNNTIHFGLRGRQEHQTMLWGDIELEQTSAGTEYLAFTERCTKTRNGITNDPRAFIPKMFEQPGDENCPVGLYKLYADKRPEKMMEPDSKFYIAVNPNYGKPTGTGNMWYISGPMGKNKLGQIAKTMSDKANLSGKHTNHSARKTSVTKLLEADIAPTDVCQLSGHKNITSLNHYNTVSLSRQQKMSNILHNVKCNSRTTTTSTTCSDVQTSIESYDTSISDEELIIASQEIDKALRRIESYENVVVPENAGVIDLPLVHQADGSVKLMQKSNPEKMFVNCTFNAPLSIVFN